MIRRTTRRLVLVTCLYVRVTAENCRDNWTALLARKTDAYLLQVIVRGASKQYVDQPHNHDFNASVPSAVLHVTEP